MGELQEEILQILERVGEITSDDVANWLEKDHQQIVGVIKSLQSLGNVRKIENKIQREKS